MLIILIAIILLFVAGAGLLRYADSGYCLAAQDCAEFLAIVCIFFAIVCAIFFAFAGWNYLAAEYKANIINREYGTSYTQEEVFFAADVIDTVRQLDRKRVETNGDVVRD